MSIQQSLLENALNRATKEAAKLRIDDIPRPVDSAEKQRHENLVELINQKRLQLQQVRVDINTKVKRAITNLVYIFSSKNVLKNKI
jgi:hypothetical protein